MPTASKVLVVPVPVPRLALLARRWATAAAAVVLVGALGVAALAVTGSTATSVSGEGEQASAEGDVPVAEQSDTLLVFGDSVSARYNDVTGDPLQGFWSMLGDAVGAEPQVHAEGGAGFVNPGLVGCTGHTFGEQLALPGVAEAVATAGVVVVEGGRTDTQTCRRGGGFDLVPPARLRVAVEAFMAEVARLRGGSDGCTIVVVPWGPKGRPENRDRVTRVVRAAAERSGFTFVDTVGLLTERTTIEDRVHPTRRGSRALAEAILDQTPARACFVRT